MMPSQDAMSGDSGAVYAAQRPLIWDAGNAWSPEAAEARRLSILLTDIESSTKLLEFLGSTFESVVSRHLEILRNSVREHGGEEVDAHGDEYFAVFENSALALAAAVLAQRMIFNEKWPQGMQLRVRMSLHTGYPRPVRKPAVGFIGIDIHRAARICSVANGGQILISQDMLDDPDFDVPADVRVRSLGAHSLKDIRFPEMISDAVIDGLPSAFPPIRSIESRPNNLPTTNSSLINRVADKAALQTLLQQAGVGVVTLTGPGGTGKTRLSLEVATAMLDVFADGVFVVYLAPVTLPGLVAPTIAQTLGVQEFPGRPILETLIHAIGSRRMLLLLDNFEHLMPAATLLADLLRACPRLRMLVTSQEPLGLSNEREYALQPLRSPANTATSTMDEILSYPSVRLFLERGRDVRPDFSLTEATAPIVSEICRRLDGLPLAIELAASKLRLLEPQMLLRRLQQRQEPLSKKVSEQGARHQSLKHAIGWSFDLLESPEPEVFVRLAIFSGGFSIESALDICADAGTEGEILDALTSLVRKSLVQRGTSQGEIRLSLLETVREFCEDKLAEAGRLIELRRLHMDQMLLKVEAAAELLRGRDQDDGIRKILDDLDNIRAALGHAIEQRDVSAVSRFLRALLWFWIPRAQFTEGETWLARALDLSKGFPGTLERAAISDSAGWLKMMAGDWSGAMPYFSDSHRIFKRKGSKAEKAMSRMTEGITRQVCEGKKSAASEVELALKEFKRLKDTYGTGLTLTAQGEAARLEGRHQQARDYFNDALEAMQEIENVYWVDALTQNLAQVRLELGDWGGAVPLLKDMLDSAIRHNSPLSKIYYVAAMGRVALLQGKFKEAARLFGASDGLLKTLGAKLEPADDAEISNSVTAASRELGQESFQKFFDEGAKWSIEHAIDVSIKLRDF